MTTVLISGATGLVGRFITESFLRAGDDVVVMGRTWPPQGLFSEPVEWVAGDLVSDRDFAPAFDDVDVFIHCAFSHVSGRYRGGEGDDPDGFWKANVDGTLHLITEAKRSGVNRAIFLSSRAVYGPHDAGSMLDETTLCRPDTLYGEAKLAVERGLSAMADAAFPPVILRPTGVYGPGGSGRRHKWSNLFAEFSAGKPIKPRIGTEVHGDDLGDAVRLLATLPTRDLAQFGAAPCFNASDVLLDRRDLLTAYSDRTGIAGVLPASADASVFNVMDCSRLKSLGWEPRGALDLTGLV